MKYIWNSGYHSTVKAEVVAGALEELAQERHHRLTAASIVEAARDGTSPLHTVFEWDDTKAATQHRLNQARTMVRAIVVLSEKVDEPESYRAYVRVQEDDVSSYISTVAALSDADLREQVLQRAIKEAKQWRTRYEDLAELSGVRSAIADLVPND